MEKKNLKTQRRTRERRWVSVNRGSHIGWENNVYCLEGPVLFMEVSWIKMRRMPVALISCPGVLS